MVSKSRPVQRNLDEGSLFLYKSSFPLNQAWKKDGVKKEKEKTHLISDFSDSNLET